MKWHIQLSKAKAMSFQLILPFYKTLALSYYHIGSSLIQIKDRLRFLWLKLAVRKKKRGWQSIQLLCVFPQRCDYNLLDLLSFLKFYLIVYSLDTLFLNYLSNSIFPYNRFQSYFEIVIFLKRCSKGPYLIDDLK